MKSLPIYSLNDSSIGSDMSSLELVKSSSTYINSIEESEECRSGTETDSSSMDENNESNHRSSSNEKDSGVDCGELDIIVDEQLIESIVKQVESYFSDENLMKDEFVLKHIRRNREGYISLKLVSSFRKVKVLTKNWKVVAHCIKVGSKKLEINDSCTKIRRKSPLPTLEGNKYSRTIIAYNFVDGSDTIEEMGRIFSRFGDISLIRIQRPNPDAVIAANLLSLIGKQFDVSKTAFATIEFNNKCDAEKAFKNMELNKNNNWRNSIGVIHMKTLNAKSNKSTNKCSERYIHTNKDKDLKTSDVKENSNEEKRKRCMKSFNKHLNEMSTHCESNNHLNRYPFLRQKSKSCSEGDQSNMRSKINDFKSSTIRNTNTNSTHGSKLPSNIIRYPLGPDGTNGFNTTRPKRSHSEP